MQTEEQRVLDELYNRDSRSGWEYSDTKIKKTVNKQELPDAEKHQTLSFIKSGIRIFGYALILLDPISAVITLIISEVVGIVEELV